MTGPELCLAGGPPRRRMLPHRSDNRPLFYTSFLLADRLMDDDLAATEVVVLSSSIPAVYADVAGDPQLNEALRSQLGDALVRSIVLAVTRHEAATSASGGSSADEMFFAPTRIKERVADWGRAGLDRRFADAWDRGQSASSQVATPTGQRCLGPLHSHA